MNTDILVFFEIHNVGIIDIAVQMMMLTRKHFSRMRTARFSDSKTQTPPRQ